MTRGEDPMDRYRLLGGALAAVVALSLATGAAAKPPAAPSLKETAAAIVAGINEHAHWDFKLTVPKKDPVRQVGRAHDAVLDLKTCKLTWSETSTEPKRDEADAIPLREVSIADSEVVRLSESSAGATVEPDHTVVNLMIMDRERLAMSTQRAGQGEWKDYPTWGLSIVFPDEAAARRVAEAIFRAVKLCRAAHPDKRPRAKVPGPSLAETTKFLCAKIDGYASWDYAKPKPDGSKATSRGSVSGCFFEEYSCGLSYAVKFADGGMAARVSVPLRYVSLGELKLQRYYELEGGSPEEPEHYALKLPIANNEKRVLWRMKGASTVLASAVLPFADKAMAERVQKAIEHAAKLCGGKGEEKEPF
jgi:hypothetical protein